MELPTHSSRGRKPVHQPGTRPGPNHWAAHPQTHYARAPERPGEAQRAGPAPRREFRFLG